MASDTYKVLMTIAKSFEEQNKPLEAIKCLQAICQSERGEYPQLEAEARLKLATLLLEHTFNVKEATRHLDRASLVLSKVEGSLSLKCSILSKLAACHSQAKGAKQLKATCEAALAICKKGAASPEGDKLVQWRLHFHTVIAQMHAGGGEPQEAIDHLNAAVDVAGKSGKTDAQALLLLGVLQTRIIAGEHEAVPAALTAAASAVKEASRRPSAAISTAYLRLHHEVLRAAWLLQIGDAKSLMTKAQGADKGALPIVVDQLHRLSREVGLKGGGYDWIDSGCLAALAQIICSGIWRPTGKFAKALQHLEEARSLLKAAEAGLPCRLQDGEAGIPPQRKMAVRQLLWLRTLVLEHLAAISTTREELEDAGGHLAAFMQLLSDFPVLLSGQRATLHMLAGAYCQETQEYQAAVAHYEAAASCSDDSAMRQTAVAHQALLLCSLGDKAALVKALDVLKQHHLFSGASLDMATPESAMGCFASASVLLGQGEDVEGRNQLMKALRLAHGSLQNHQFVAKIMCVLGPTFLDSDLAAVKNMSSSALSLAKGVSDLTTQVAAAKLVCEWMRRSGEAGKLPEQQEYVLRKESQLGSAIGQARSHSEQHASILQWALDPANPSAKRQRRQV